MKFIVPKIIPLNFCRPWSFFNFDSLFIEVISVNKPAVTYEDEKESHYFSNKRKSKMT